MRSCARLRHVMAGATLLALISGCGGSIEDEGQGAQTASPISEEPVDGTSEPAPPGSTAPSSAVQAIAAGTEVIVTCDLDTSTLQVFDAGTGAVLHTNTTPVPPVGEFVTDAGAASFVEADTGGLGCKRYSFNADFSRIAGTASFPDGRQVAASVNLEGTSLELATEPPASGEGFSAAAPSEVRHVIYTADGTLWWLEVPSEDSNEYLVKSDAGDEKSFTLEADFASAKYLYRDGAGDWVVAVDATGYGDNSTHLQDGSLVDSVEAASFRPSLDEILPETQYTVFEGHYNLSGDSIAFFAAPPGSTPEAATLFRVPVTGGEPSALAEGLPAGDIVYFGQYQGSQ